MTINNLFCIDLDQPRLTGFRKFISSWCFRYAGKTFLVDPGPLSTIPHLLRALKGRGIEHLDTILLTHIHIDHAGGCGELLKHYPEAQVICHPKGIEHLIAPQKLWQGSLKVLGKTAQTYGEIIAVPKERIAATEEIDGGIRCYQTPGHAVHHCCYLVADLLFAGEVAGVRCAVPEGIYMRPATPPRFILEVALDALERMIALAPQRMVFAHYGLVDNALRHLRIGRDQLKLWVRGAAAVAGLDPAKRVAAFTAWLLARDAHFARLDQLPADLQQREREFIGNSLRGMSDYVAGLSAAARRELAA